MLMLSCKMHDNIISYLLKIQCTFIYISLMVIALIIFILGTPSNGAIILSRCNYSSTSYYYGTVRVYYDDGWGNICYDNYYSYNDANVICHQLGYTGASNFSRSELTKYILYVIYILLIVFSVMVLTIIQ